MVQQVKALAVKSDDLNLILGSAQWKDRKDRKDGMDSCGLSSNSHMHIVTLKHVHVYTCAYTHTQRNKK